MHGGEGGGGNWSSSAVATSSSELSGKILVQDPDLRMGVDIKLEPKASAAFGGPAHERIESTLEPSPSGVPGPDDLLCLASLSQFACDKICDFILIT